MEGNSSQIFSYAHIIQGPQLVELFKNSCKSRFMYIDFLSQMSEKQKIADEADGAMGCPLWALRSNGTALVNYMYV